MSTTRRRAALAGAAYASVNALSYLAGIEAASAVARDHWSLAVPRFALDPQAFDLL